MFGTARFASNDSRPEILVPDEAISSDQSTKFVYVVDDSNKVERRLVEVGFLYNNLRVIRNGLTENDRVVINGIQKAMPGQPVTPEEGEITIARRES
jgi:multidrug efflux pump subunit AcrA (membrane-fusion protein)